MFDRLPDNDKGSLLELLPVTDAPTKAAIDGSGFPTDRSLVVSAYFNSERSDRGNYFNNTSFRRDASSGTWSAVDPKYWPAGGSLDIFAYSCDGLTVTNQTYPSKWSDGVTITLSDNRTQQTDVLFGHFADNTRIASGNPMTMRHACALLVFTARSNIAYDASSNVGVTINKITVENAYYSGRLSVNATAALYSQCTWDNLGSQGNKDLPSVGSSAVNLPYNVPTSSASVTADGWHMGLGGAGILVPEQAQTRLCIEYVLHSGTDDDGNRIDNTMLYQWDCSGTWEEGHKYVYDLRFQANQIEIVPSVLNWDALTVDVRKVPDLRIDVPESFVYGSGQRFYVRTDSDEYGDVYITFNGVTYTRTLYEGEASCALNLNAGTYTAVVEYPGNSVFQPWTESFTFTVLAPATMEDLVKYFRSPEQLWVTYRPDANWEEGMEVTFNINGVFYTRRVNAEGKVELRINLSPGSYICTFLDPLTGYSCSANVTVLPKLEVLPYDDSEKKLWARTLDDYGNILSGQEVEFNCNENVTHSTSDANGMAYLDTSTWSPGTYTTTVRYGYESHSVSLTIN